MSTNGGGRLAFLPYDLKYERTLGRSAPFAVLELDSTFLLSRTSNILAVVTSLSETAQGLLSGMAPSAEDIRLRAERAAKGDKTALKSIQQCAAKNQQLKKLRDDAAAGDKQAQLHLEEQRVQGRLKMRQQRAKDQAKRDAGDVDAIARYQRSLERGRKWCKERDANKRAQRHAIAGTPGGHVGSTDLGERFIDDDMSGVEEDDDPTLDEEYDGTNDDAWFASRRSPIARSAKKRVRYDEDVGTEEHNDYDEFRCDGDGGAAVEATLDHDVEGGVTLGERSAAATPVASGELSDPVEHVEQQDQQQDFKPPVGADVVDLCDSDDEVKVSLPAVRQTQKLTKGGTRVKNEPVTQIQRIIKVEAGAESPREQVYDEAPTSSQPDGRGTPASGNRSAEMLRKRKQLELRRRDIQLQRAENELDRELLELED